MLRFPSRLAITRTEGTIVAVTTGGHAVVSGHQVNVTATRQGVTRRDRPATLHRTPVPAGSDMFISSCIHKATRVVILTTHTGWLQRRHTTITHACNAPPMLLAPTDRPR